MKHLYESLRTCAKEEKVKVGFCEFFNKKIFALSSSIAVFFAMFAAATDIRPVLPPVEYPDTEVVTNMAVSAQGSREYTFALAFSGTVSNNVEIAFGTDADADGALSVDEIGLSAGWDCGEWFVKNEATGERDAA